MSQRHRIHSTTRFRRLARAVKERASYKCEGCGKRGRLQIDHVKPMSDGGEPFDMNNLQALCRDCHTCKTTMENTKDPGRKAWVQRQWERKT